jgi:hypothetical protein
MIGPQALHAILPTIQINHIGLVNALRKWLMDGEVAPMDIEAAAACKGLAKTVIAVDIV